MWLLKGVGLELVVFAGFFAAYFSIVIAGGLRPHTALGVSAVTGATIHKPLFWVALLLTISTCCAYTKLLAH